MMEKNHYLKSCFLGILGIVLLDQFSKWYVMERVLNQTSFIKINDYFNLVLVFNKGVSFSLFNDYGAKGRFILILVGLIITAALLLWLWRATNWALSLGLSCIIGGALGNLIDRIYQPGVVDFIQVHWKHYYWPAFNVADSFITLGVIFVLLESFVQKGDRSVS